MPCGLELCIKVHEVYPQKVLVVCLLSIALCRSLTVQLLNVKDTQRERGNVSDSINHLQFQIISMKEAMDWNLKQNETTRGTKEKGAKGGGKTQNCFNSPFSVIPFSTHVTLYWFFLQNNIVNTEEETHKIKHGSN